MDPRDDDDDSETITLATLVSVDPNRLTVRHPDGVEGAVALSRTPLPAERATAAPEVASPAPPTVTGAPAAPTPPTAPARFEPLGHVGKGAMGEILLVRDRELWRKVAFKRLLPEVAHNRSVVARFFNEAQVTAQLEHPHIVPIYQLDDGTGGALGYTMKLVRGETLSDVIARDRQRLTDAGHREEPRRLSERLALWLDVCDAIAYAHTKRVLHRDLKPDNIMVGAWGEVYVMDWGIFRLLDRPPGAEAEGAVDAEDDVVSTGDHGRTQFGAVIGTPAWMSPEQAAGRVPELGPASDQYALGLILYTLVTLRPPRPRDSLAATLLRAGEGTLEPIAYERGRWRVPRELAAIIRRATALAPAARYPDVAALADDVRAYLRGDAVGTQRDRPLQAVARFVAKHKVGAAVGLAVLLVAGVVAAAAVRLQADAAQAALVRHVQRVEERARGADIALHELEVAAMRLAGQVGVAMVGPAPSPAPPVYDSAAFDAGRGPQEAGSRCWVETIAGRATPVAISLAAPVLKLAPGLDDAHGRPVAERLAGLGPALGAALRHPFGSGPAVSDAQLVACEVPVRRTFATVAVAMPAAATGGTGATGASRLGVHASFPGVGGYCPRYDGLRRPKYTAVRSPASPVVWGEEVYPDRYGAGLLVAASAPVVDGRGELIGVAGLELTLGWLTRALLAEPEAPWVKHAYLVTPQGRVIATDAGLDAGVMAPLSAAFDPCEEGPATGPSAHAALPSLPIAEVRDAIARGEEAGHLRAEVAGEEALVVFRRFNATGWYYVVAADEGALP